MVLEKVPTFQEVKDWAASKTELDNHINDTDNPHNVSADAPVDDVNGQTGSVNLNYNDVGAKSDSYSAPVDSVNGKTGSVSVDTGPGTLVASGTADPSSDSAVPVSDTSGTPELMIASPGDVYNYGAVIYTPPDTNSSYIIAIGPTSSSGEHNYAVYEP